jgi:oligosaccharide 4-alpha-D-glucosyltransferase
MKLHPEEKLTGGGERVLGVNRRGHTLELYNKPSYGYETFAELMYYSMPVVISSWKYVLTFDNGAHGWLDLGDTDRDILEFKTTGGRLSYILTVADEWPELIENFTESVGRQEMLPRWAFGNISSRMGYKSQRETEEVVQKFIDEDIPLDGIVLDLYWFGPDLKGHMGNLEWYRDSFPEAENMMKNFAEKGVKTVLITEPFVLKNTAKYNEVLEKELVGLNPMGEAYHYDFYFGNTTLLDVFKKDTKDWYWDIYKNFTNDGVAGWWGDLGEPEVHPDDMLHVNGTGRHVHNLYGHEWAKLIYDGYQRDFSETRPVILMRAGYVGSQRYGMVPWSGDVNRSWGGLQSQVEVSLTMGLQGLGYMHSDLGGFAGDYKDAELYTRWLQYGVFQPIYRTHGQEEVPAEPVFWDEETKNICRNFIKLRYRLMPYLYTLGYENSQTGLPLMRPLFFMEDKVELFDYTDAYLLGNDFLVSPVTKKGINTQDVYFPYGYRWFDFWTNQQFEGGKYHSIDVSPDKIPVFVKAGSFIPMTIESVQSTQTYSTRDLMLHYYFDPKVSHSSGYMYDDDGTTRNSDKINRHEILKFDADLADGMLKIRISSEGNGYPNKPISRNIQLLIHMANDQEVSDITAWLNDRKTEYNIQNNKVLIPIKFDGNDVVFSVKLGEN